MKATKDSANLDVLRAIAVMCVFFAHVLHFSRGGSFTEFQRHLGQLGVIMFFVHTSLVLMFSLERARLDGPALFFSFYTRRVFRIYPLSILCVLCVYFIHYRPELPLLYATWTHKEIFANVTLTQNLLGVPDLLPVLWTLPLEVQMYIFLPFLFVAFRSRSIRPLLLLWLASIPAGILQLHYMHRNLVTFVPCFLAGVISWRLHAPQRDRLPGWLWPVCIALLSLIWFTGPVRYQMYFHWGFCLLLGLAIPFFVEISNRAVHMIASTIAKYSYGIYLTHTAAIVIGFSLLRNRFAEWSVAMALATALPLLMYHLVEHPGIQAGKKISNWLWEPARRIPRVAPELPVPTLEAEAQQGPQAGPNA